MVAPQMVAPVEIITLGRFEVRVGGAPLTFPHKVPRRPLALLKALVAAGGREVPEVALIDALWPDLDGDAAAAALATALHRLRRLLGHGGVVTRRDGRLGLDPERCRVDAWLLEQLLARAELVGLAGRRGEPQALAGEAIALYRGPFLPADLDQPWTTSMRERLRARLLRLLAAVGRHHEELGRLEEAAAWYERGLDLDDGAEALCRRAMAAYARLGRPAEALALYERCRRQLHAGLGVLPGPETEALRQQLHVLAASAA